MDLDLTGLSSRLDLFGSIVYILYLHSRDKVMFSYNGVLLELAY